MSAVGFLGGGQLALMLAQAAHTLGHTVVIYAAPGDNVAFREADVAIEGAYNDRTKLGEFAKALAGGPATLEFENIPLATLAMLKEMGVAVRPDSRALAAAQDRSSEKRLAESLGMPTTRNVSFFAGAVPGKDVLSRYTPGILKTTRMGYDGRGQTRVETCEDVRKAAQELENQPLILERLVDFSYETSVIIARNARGEMLTFPSTVNEHEGGILRRTVHRPDCVKSAHRQRAQSHTAKLAEHLDYVGVLAVEFFALSSGMVLFNEMAPRVHNTGHWTIEGCETSQFMACIQAITGTPFTPVGPCSFARMTNIIGVEVPLADAALLKSGHVHDYGKSEARLGRKMGHVTEVI